MVVKKDEYEGPGVTKGMGHVGKDVKESEGVVGLKRGRSKEEKGDKGNKFVPEEVAGGSGQG